MNSFVEQIRNLGPARLAAMAGVAIGMLAFIIYFATRLSTQPMELLYGDLASGDAKAIIAELDVKKIPYELRANGTEVFIPADQVLKQRVQMAELALPTGGSVGYEVFDSMDKLGATNFMQNINLVRALEGELARTVMSIEGVKAARVHLVLPRREMFTREEQKPTAAIYVRMERGRLTEAQAVAIQHMVAASVPKLEPSSISIIDERGTLLASGAEDSGSMMLSSQEELRRKEEARLARSVEQLLESVLGPGKVRAEVSLDMDFDKVVTNQEIYDPDSQVARSTVTREETLAQQEASPQGVSVANNLPNADLNGSTTGVSNNEGRTEETVNYEISRKVVNQIKEGPQVNRLSVAVLVDGTYSTAETGDRIYQPRPELEMDQLAALVRSTIGFDANRGDQVELVNMQFTGWEDLTPVPEEFNFAGFNKEEIMRMAEGLGVAVVAVLVILLVVRPLVTRAFEGSATGADGRLLTADGQMVGGAPQLLGPGSSVPAPIPEEEDISEELIDIDKVEGRVKASSLRKIGEIVEKHPEEALAIIRNWLYQET